MISLMINDLVPGEKYRLTARVLNEFGISEDSEPREVQINSNSSLPLGMSKTIN